MDRVSDTANLREQMVARDIAGRGIRDPRVLDAFRRVKRHRFVPEDLRNYAYDDRPLPIGNDQTISQPYIVALMTQCLRLTGKERVLEIGTGSGYQTAILAELAREVYSVERVVSLSEHAQKTLTELGYENLQTIIGDGSLGLPQHAPFDRIIVTAAAPQPPAPLVAQLAVGGIMVVPTGTRARQEMAVITKNGDGLTTEIACRCVFVPLIGNYGYEK